MKPQALKSPATPTPLLAWLLTTLAPMPRSRVKKLLSSGAVQINGRAVTQFDEQVRPGDAVMIGPPVSNTALPVLFEDAHYIVVDKPAGLLTVATESEKESTAFRRVAAMLPQRPYVVHRLDRDTSGLLVFAKTAEARDQLQAAWESVEKTYLAIVEGTPPVEGVIDNHIVEGKSLRVRVCHENTPGAKRAVSRYRVLKPGRLSLVEIIIETGRKHQIRVHMSHLGHPIIGDAVYSSKVNPAKRLGLHAHRIRWLHPFSHSWIELESSMPNSLARLLPI